MPSSSEKAKGFADLLRLHFSFAWPILFCSGTALAFFRYGGFSWLVMAKCAVIGFCGFEAGMVLNDYVDRDLDSKDVEGRLTGYWRVFKKRPIPSGLVSPGAALAVVIVLIVVATILILTLPFPNSAYLLAIMAYSYCAEVFYQLKKRSQKYPVAQLVGRTDFALFPVAGYLAVGSPDLTALMYFAFFYPFALAHLAANDIIDIENDKVRGLKSVPVLYGQRGAAAWLVGFLIAHFVLGFAFMYYLGTIALCAFLLPLGILSISALTIWRGPTPEKGMKILPTFHLSMLIYTLTFIIQSFW